MMHLTFSLVSFFTMLLLKPLFLCVKLKYCFTVWPSHSIIFSFVFLFLSFKFIAGNFYRIFCLCVVKREMLVLILFLSHLSFFCHLTSMKRRTQRSHYTSSTKDMDSDEALSANHHSAPQHRVWWQLDG